MPNTSGNYFKDVDIFSMSGVEQMDQRPTEYPYVVFNTTDTVLALDFIWSPDNRKIKRLQKVANGYSEQMNWLDDDGTEISEITAYQTGSYISYTMMPDETEKPFKKKAIKIVYAEPDSVTEWMIHGGVEMTEFFISKEKLDTLIDNNKEKVHMLIKRRVIKTDNDYWRIEEVTTNYDYPDITRKCYLYKRNNRSWYWTTFHFDIPETCILK